MDMVILGISHFSEVISEDIVQYFLEGSFLVQLNEYKTIPFFSFIKPKCGNQLFVDLCTYVF